MVTGIVIAFIASSIATSYFLQPARRIRRALRKAPVTRIADAKDGVLRIRGRACAIDQHLVAPVSKRRCLAFTLWVAELKSSGRPLRWTPIVWMRARRRRARTG
jgi:hypothetical protein